MEELKLLSAISTADERWRYFRITLEDLHESATSFLLNEEVPEQVKNQFMIAANAYVYSWNYYPFLSVALMYSVLAIELALRWRLLRESPEMFRGEREPTLYPLLLAAIQRRWIVDERFEIEITEDFQVPTKIAKRFANIPIDQRYSYSLLDTLVDIRNGLTHGDPLLIPSMAPLIQRGVELINQIYPTIKNETTA